MSCPHRIAILQTQAGILTYTSTYILAFPDIPVADFYNPENVLRKYSNGIVQDSHLASLLIPQPGGFTKKLIQGIGNLNS
jgi:hypothetical protein